MESCLCSAPIEKDGATASTASSSFPFYVNFILLKDSQEANFSSSPRNAMLESITDIRIKKALQAPEDRLLIEIGESQYLTRFLGALLKRIPLLLNDLGFEHSSSKYIENQGLASIYVDCTAIDVRKFFNGGVTGDVSVLPANKLDTEQRRKIRAMLPSRIEVALKSLGLHNVMIRCPSFEIQLAWCNMWTSVLHAAVTPWLFTSRHRVLYAIANQRNYLSSSRGKGLLRPWILLVSMYPERRKNIAKALNISVDVTYGFKPASEAHDILMGPKGICNSSIWKATATEMSKQNDAINPWVKLLIREGGASSIDIPEDVLRLERPANFGLARERSNRADDLCEPARLERLLLLHQQSRSMKTMPVLDFGGLSGAMEGLEGLCLQEARQDAELEMASVGQGEIFYQIGVGWHNRKASAHWWNPFTTCAARPSGAAMEYKAQDAVVAILRQRLVLAHENTDFSKLVAEGAKQIS
eukprot:GEMP01018194.1.p1 GENE.GEMP01018194.1~~GEMP01018194.1.p1  ORF type:complete len:471 (-),score=89.75 GEMP01018194.1:983-2395(-)